MVALNRRDIIHQAYLAKEMEIFTDLCYRSFLNKIRDPQKKGV